MSGAGLHDHRLATATVQRRYYYPRCAARDARSRTPVTRPLFAAIAIAMVMSVQGGQRARGRAVTVQLCKLCWQEGAARCRTCTHWEDSQGRLSSPLRNTHCTLHAHQSPADSRRALETRAGHRAAALQCRTKADHEWRSPCWPLFSSTHSTACSSPSPIAHRPSPIAHRPSPRCCYTTAVAKDPLASESAQGGRILAGCVSVVSQAP